MIISFDIDGCVTTHPQLFLAMGRGIRAAGGELHFITARAEWMRIETVQLLVGAGFDFLKHSHDEYLHMFPDHYVWPWESPTEEERIRRAHAEWKAEKCAALGIHVHYDDCPYIIERLGVAGVPTFHVR